MKILTELLFQGIMHYQLKVLGGHVYEEDDSAQLMVRDEKKRPPLRWRSCGGYEDALLKTSDAPLRLASS